MTSKKVENITLLPYAQRVKLVQDRMRDLERPKIVDLPKSKRVIAAEKVVADYDYRNEAYTNDQRRASYTKLNLIRDALIVGDMVKAVELLNKYEA